MNCEKVEVLGESAIKLKDVTANPAPLGLLGFGITTVLLNMHNAGFFGLGSMILAMGIFYGGLAQVIAGIMEFKKNNTFGATAFTSYGFFWISLTAIIIMPKLGIAAAATNIEMAAYLGMWGIFTLVMFIGTFKLSRELQVVFGSLTLLFLLLALGDATEISGIKILAGYEGILCGLSAIYAGLSQVIKELYKRK